MTGTEDQQRAIQASNSDLEGLSADGRAARGARSRSAIVDALLDLIQEGHLRPPAHRIAEKAGVSLRTVFVHFSDLDNLLVAAGARHLERIAHVFEPVPDDGSLPDRLDAFVAQRTRWFEHVRNVRRAAELQEPFSPQVARMTKVARHAARSEVQRVFAIELSASRMNNDLLAALDAASSFGSWYELRVHQKLSRARTAEVMRRTLKGLLDSG
jgi:TetR/AcrR family transcriptional regulator, regulator of autoinduction and epiphytic fitness